MAVVPATDRISIFGQASQDAIINHKRGNMAMNPDGKFGNESS
jgi:hypothetical protein